MAESAGTQAHVTRWSERSDASDLPLNAIAEAIVARRSQGLPLDDLTLSNPTRAGIEYPETLFAHQAGASEYAPESLGLLQTREQIASHMRDLGVACDAPRMLLTASTSEAYGFVFKLLCNPGDEVLVPAPSYPLFEHLARMESVNAVSYPLLLEDEFRLDLEQVRARITERTRAIVVVSPNNPTGSMLRTDELSALARLGLPIVSDEVFGEFLLRPARDHARTALDTPDALVFSLFGLSKLVGLPQAKLAWTCVSGPEADVTEAMQRLAWIADTYLSVSTQVQLNAPRLLSLGASVRQQIRERTTYNLNTLERLSHDCPSITVLAPQGGWSVVIRVPATQSEEAWVLQLVDAGVLVHPGHFYDFDREAFLVLSLLPDVATFERGVRRICDCVNGTLG